MSAKYPNLEKEMAAIGLDKESLIVAAATYAGRTDQSARSWIDGKRPFPTRVAFYIKDTYFPDLTIEYLFAQNDTNDAPR